MRIFDLIAMCARNLTRRKFRTFLTVVGVVIGTCAIVVMISLGIGISETSRAMLESYGDLTLIEINNYGNTETVLDDAAMDAIRDIPGVDVATPIVEMRFNQSSQMLFVGPKKRYSWYAWGIVGVSPEAMEKMGYVVARGEMLEPSSGGKKIRVIFGENTAYDFEDTKKRWPNNRIDYWSVGPDEEKPDPFFDPMESSVSLEISSARQDGKPLEYEIEVVGVFKGDYRRGNETMYGVAMDINDLNRIKSEYNKANGIKKEIGSSDGYEMAKVKCTDIGNVAAVEETIKGMGFINTYSMENERRAMQENAQQIQLILGILGGVSLLVAAISITNTMIMSVYERTREIGVMKVLGCLIGNIRSVFLIEAALIGFIGGLLGDGISCLGSWLLNTFGGDLGAAMGIGGGGYYGAESFTPRLSVVPPWLMLLGLVFATSIGLVAGILPAMRAVKISALEAIRTE